MFSTRQADEANYATAGIALPILLVRLGVGRLRGRPIDAAFYLILLSIISITARVTLNWYSLRLGSTNDAFRDPNYLRSHKPSDVMEGSKVLLAGRAALTCSLWLQVCLLLIFYSQIMQSIVWVKNLIRVAWVATGVSFVVVTLFTFLECRPLHKYWQLHPDPGQCVKAYGQLLAQCVSNIILDLVLLAISFPILFHRGRTWAQHLRVGALFMLGTFCIVVTAMRLTAVYGNNGLQSARTLWGAVQIIVSTFVANAPTTYGDIKVIQRKIKRKQTQRSSQPESWVRASVDEEAALEQRKVADGASRPSHERQRSQKEEPAGEHRTSQPPEPMHTIEDST